MTPETPRRRRVRRRAFVAALTAACALALPAAAAAHVSIVPGSAPAGAYQVLDVRVPNEREDAATVKVDVQLPPGFVAASYEPLPGWRTEIVREQLDRPIETENGPISEQVARIVWSGDGSPEGSIPPGGFRDFPVSLKLPDESGATLTFKALQTYRGGEVVRWIGAPDAELPAATVELTAAGGEGDGAGAGHGAGADDAAGEEAGGASTGDDADDTAPAATASDGDDDGGSDGLAIAALVVGAGGLLLGGGALAVALRGRR